MYCQQVGVDSKPAGLVVHVKVTETGDQPCDQRPVPPRMLLPGLIGDAPLWQRACHQVESTFTSGTWLALEGESGVGKLALLRAVQLRQQPTRRFAVLDAQDSSTDPTWMTTVRRALAEADSVLLTHVDVLDVRRLRVLSSSLQEAKLARDQLWVAATLRPGAGDAELEQLLSYFPTTVSVAPLRLRLEDLPRLVSFMLAKLSHGGHVTCSSEAMRLLMRSPWPGNVEQLQQVLHQVVQHRRSGSIKAEDLPPEMHSISRRVLSTLESMERDAIVRSLADANGNKLQAARFLGMSRATIYRKIREFGIVTPS